MTTQDVLFVLFICFATALVVELYIIFDSLRQLRLKISLLEAQIPEKASTEQKVDSLEREVDAIKKHIGVQTTVVREHVAVVQFPSTSDNG